MEAETAHRGKPQPETTEGRRQQAIVLVLVLVVVLVLDSASAGFLAGDHDPGCL
jgi:hypothetical protein